VDVLLVAAPLVLPAATYAIARRAAYDRQTALDLSLAVCLATAFVSCLLAVFWI
jgi:undecaprenyl pyrophosphate phosphatase UppP